MGIVCPLWYCCSFPKYWFLPPMPEFDSLIWLEACNGQCSILIHLLPFYPDIYRFVEQLGYPVQIVSTAGIVFWCNCNNKLLIDHYQRINNKFSKSITWVEWRWEVLRTPQVSDISPTTSNWFATRGAGRQQPLVSITWLGKASEGSGLRGRCDGWVSWDSGQSTTPGENNKNEKRIWEGIPPVMGCFGREPHRAGPWIDLCQRQDTF